MLRHDLQRRHHIQRAVRCRTVGECCEGVGVNRAKCSTPVHYRRHSTRHINDDTYIVMFQTHHASHPLVAPRVRPDTNCLCNTNNTIWLDRLGNHLGNSFHVTRQYECGKSQLKGDMKNIRPQGRRREIFDYRPSHQCWDVSRTQG